MLVLVKVLHRIFGKDLSGWKLMQKGDQEFLNYINFVLAELKMDGTLAKLEKKYLYK